MIDHVLLFGNASKLPTLGMRWSAVFKMVLERALWVASGPLYDYVGDFTDWDELYVVVVYLL